MVTKNNLFLGLALFLTTLPLLSGTTNARPGAQRPREADLQSTVAASMITAFQEDLERKEMEQALAESRLEADLQSTVAASMITAFQDDLERKEMEQALAKSLKNQSTSINQKELNAFNNLLSNIEIQRIQPGRLIRETIINGTHYQVLQTRGDGCCGLHALGIRPEDANELIRLFRETRYKELGEMEQQEANKSITYIETLLKDASEILDVETVASIGRLMLDKHVKFLPVETMGAFNDFSHEPEKLIYVDYTPGHFSRVVQA